MLCVKTVEVSDERLSRMEQFRANKTWVLTKMILWSILLIFAWGVSIEVATDDLPLSIAGDIPEWIFVWLPVLALTVVLGLDINDTVTQQYRTPDEINEANRQAIESIEVE